LFMLSDAAVLTFGADKDVTVTHVADAGIMINAAMQLRFRDSAISIGSPADGDLDINADDEIELNSTLIDVNGNVEISGTLAQADTVTMATNKKIQFRDTAIHISSTADGDLSIAADDEVDITSTLIDINGNVDISGTALITGVATHGDDVVSDTDSTDDLGTTGVRWANLYVDAITATDQITATGFTGTLDGILGSGAAAAATTTTLASTTITASGIIKTDDTTAATSTTDGSLQTDGGLSVAADAVIGDDLILLSDAAVLSFGANSEIALTHVHDTGLLLTDSGGSPTLQLHNASEAVSSDGSKLILTSNGVAFSLPTADGSSDQVLSTDGSGTLSFASAAAAATYLPSSADGQALGSASLEWSDLFLADGGTVTFGNDQDVTLTHVADTGLLLNSTMKIQFNDASQFIHAPSATVLDIAATDEIELTATLIDVVGNLTVSGTIVGAGALTAATSITVGSAVLLEAELELLDGLTAGTAIASKVVTTDESIDTTGQRNLTISGELDAATLDISGAIDVAGNSVLASVDVTGVATAATFEPDGDTSAADNAAIGYTAAEGLILTGQGSTSDITLKNDADATVFTVPTGTDDILFPDSAKAMWGAGSDLQISHNGSHSNILESGTGNLYIGGDADVLITNASTTENKITASTNGAVTLYYDNAVKIATASTGVTITGSITANNFAGRNILYNGAMNVAQRSASVTGLGAAAGYFTTDRWRMGIGAASAGRFTMAQIADGPAGFANCTKLSCTTADTSIAAGEDLILTQYLEGQDLQQIKKGTASAEQLTLSFWVKGNASATYVAELYDVDNDRQISKTFAVTTSWAKITLLIPADTTGAFDDDNATSLGFSIWLHAGSSYTGGTLNASAWAGNNNANRAAGIDSFFDATDRTFFITGVQLERGATATEFEFVPHGIEKESCKRYFYRLGGAVNALFEKGRADGGGYDGANIFHNPEMRAAPTIAKTGTFAVSNVGQPAWTTVNATTGYYQAQISANGAYNWYSNDAAHYVSFDAEL